MVRTRAKPGRRGGMGEKMANRAIGIFVWIWSKIPILGGLTDCGIDEHKDAIYQVGTSLIFGTMPLWLIWIILVAKHIDAYAAFRQVVDNGALFMYSAATLAPIFYIALREDRRLKKFPSRLEHVVFVIIVLLLCVYAFGVIKMNPDFLDKEFLYLWSVRLFATSIVLVYLATAYETTRVESLRDELATSAEKLTGEIGGMQ
jgi:hypothetical protein